MKEAYAVRRTVPPSAEIQEKIDGLLATGMVGEDPSGMLSELARLGARLIIQRAVEDEFDTWLGRARYERRPEGSPGKRNGFRPRHLQTGEGELRIEIPQAREAVMPFVSKLFPKWHCKRLLRTDPLKALIVGAFVRGLSMRDVESLCEEAGLGKISRSTVARICSELHERFAAFCRRSLYDINLVVLFLDAIYLPVRPSGPKEGVICAWGITENGERALVSVRLGCARPRRTGSSSAATSLPADSRRHAWSLPTARPGCPRRSRRSGRGPIANTAPFTGSGTSRRSSRSQSTTGSVSTTGQRSPTRRRSRTASSASRS
jgi:hypothetical protein